MPAGLMGFAYAAYWDMAYAGNALKNMGSMLDSAGHYLQTGDFNSAGGRLKSAAIYANEAYDWFHDDSPACSHNLLYAFECINDNWPDGAAELTYKDIVEAWFKNDFEGRAITIACIDRMRQKLWNEPFNAIWAARPEEQEF